ncbi:MAG: sodium:solute symporter [Saprospiraceae bacterium]|nr:sodium:solute symporter [Saprospiraceae bacterium]
MHWIDWLILIGTLVGITGYGMYKTRGATDMQTYLLGSKDLKWWTIGLSIMATQASAITFLSTTGQGYEDGMRFAQFYIGLPIAMVILSAFFLPIYYRLSVMTAYEYLERRFDLRTRTLAASLFLLQRGMSAGLTIYAPAIVLSVILGWNLGWVCFCLGIFVILYTVFGGGEAVSVTQEQQMIVILAGLMVAFVIMIFKMPEGVHFTDALNVAGKLGKTNVISFKFDLSDRYNFWSGIFGGTFLFLSYFGTDQSQVQRYLSGKTLSESRLGLLFNGVIKLPMQFLVLFVGVMMFVFFQFNKSPIHFNPENLAAIQTPQYQPQLDALEAKRDVIFEAKKSEINNLILASRAEDRAGIEESKTKIQEYLKQENGVKTEAKVLIKAANPKAETKDTDYAFINFVIHNLPIGIVGLLLAVIFSAAMSSTASEINALATTSIVDIYRRQIKPNESDAHYMWTSQWLTAAWGVLAMSFAVFASLLENLIEAVNIVGSLFYGTILGLFMVAFFMKKIGAKSVFAAALMAECAVITIFTLDRYGVFKFAYLWLNLVGCVLVMLFAWLLHHLFFKNEVVKAREFGFAKE